MVVDFKGFGAVLKILKSNIDDDKDNFSLGKLVWCASSNSLHFKYSLPQKTLEKMGNKFIYLLEQQNNIEEKDFKDYLVELIYYSHLMENPELKKFLESLEIIENKINTEIMINIYFELFRKYNDKIKEYFRNSILLFIIKNQNYNILIKFAENFKFFLPNILNNIKNKSPVKEDFWQLEENENLKIFKGLVEKTELFSEENIENISYAKKSFELLNQLKEKLNKNQVLYKDINVFFENNREDEKNEFKKRLSLIYYNEHEKVENKYNEINQKIGEINNALIDLKLIYDYFDYFFRYPQIRNIRIIESMISSIKDGPLDVFEKNCSKKYKELVNEFKEEAEKKTQLQKSIFFSALYNNNKTIKKLEEKERIETTEKQFNELQKIFTQEGIESINQEIIATCMNAIATAKMTIDEISKEIDYLYKILQIKISDNDKMKIVKIINLLSKRDEICKTLESVLNFVHYTNSKETKFSKSLKENAKNLLKSYSEKTINEAIQVLKEANIDIDSIIDESNSLKKDYLNILQMLREQSIKFLVKLTTIDCQTLREKVGDESFVINQNDIIDLEKCDSFMHSLEKNKNFSKMTDSELIIKFVNEIKGANEDLGVRFKNYTTNFLEIKGLFDSIKDRSEAKREKILYILKNSEFILKNTNTEFFNGYYYEEIMEKRNIEKRTKKINNIEELLELKAIAQLIKKRMDKENDAKTLLDDNKKFISIISDIYDIYILLRKINISGYTQDIEIKIKINNYDYIIDWESQKNCNDFQKVIDSLNDILNNLKTLLIKAYEEKPLIRFIYGRQFNLIKSLEKNLDNKNIDPFLMFFTRNNMTYKPKEFKFSGKNDIQSVINDCESYLNEVLKLNKLKLENIYNERTHYIYSIYKGIFIYKVSKDNDLEKVLFGLYIKMTKKFPVSQNILFCTKDISNEELTAFLYRALLCEYNSCFIIGGIESLESDKRVKILSLLNDILEKKNREIESCLIILYTNDKTDIYNSLKSLRYIRNLDADPTYNYNPNAIGQFYMGKVHFVKVEKSENLEKELYDLYQNVTKNFPVSQNILYCKKDISNKELAAFLNRAILCEFSDYFIIGGIESLESDTKNEIISLFKNILEKKGENEKKKKMESCLIIAYTNFIADIYDSLKALKNLEMGEKIFTYNPKSFEDKGLKIKAVSSTLSGHGKSRQIKSYIEENKKKYIYFPFGGDINKEDIFKRIKNLAENWLMPTKPEDCVIHLDINDSDQIELMTEFLFAILITKIYGHGENMFYFPKEIEIIIEIPNGFIDITKKFPILSLFEGTIFLSKLPDLIVDNNIISNDQIFANYFKLNDKETDKYDLAFEGFTFLNHFSIQKTRKDAIIIPKEECQKLLMEEEQIDHPAINYYLIKSFINFLASQYISFSRCYYMNAGLLQSYKKNRIRSFIVNSFRNLALYFISSSFTMNLYNLKDEKKNSDSLEYNPENELDKAIQKLSKLETNLISFDKFSIPIIFFYEGVGQGFSIISNLQNESDRKKLYALYNYQTTKKEDKMPLPVYKNYSQIDYLKDIKNMLDIKNLITKEEKDKAIKEKEEEIDKKSKEHPENTETIMDLKDDLKLLKSRLTLEEIVGKYVFTVDNYIKMVLILMKIRANIPIVMMGETGCGKTSLIKMLTRLMNNGSEENMKILNIHAGTNDDDIIKFIEKISKVAKKYEEEDRIEAEERKKLGELFIARKLWVFLDEINTTKSMGLISELMCKHTCRGKPLLSNIALIAACNPYRYYKGVKVSAGLDIKNAIKEKKNLNINEFEKFERKINSNLVYTVNPLPHSLLNFVFDFGNLGKDDEEKYIECIVEEPIKRINKNLEISEIKLIHHFAVKLISKSQNFIRDHNEMSAVSLREIRRYNIFYEFFYNYLEQKKDACNKELNEIIIREDTFYKDCDQLTLQIYSIILGIFVCYYLRIMENKTRREFEMSMDSEISYFNKSLSKKEFTEKIENKIIVNFQKHIENINFLDIPLREENYVLSNIELEKGIAQNRALLDNIFALFVSINNKIPIFIVGKPGSSKSLSVQLINRAMKGEDSNKPLFRKFPKLILTPYTGSLISTSKEVETIFIRAKKQYDNLKDENKDKNISMVFFDEMGLAEHSLNNPLKVIHAELDEALEEGKNKIAFVGISNWKLDASKMNRGMQLSIQEPDEADAKDTALNIAKSYSESLATIFKTFNEKLGETYFKYMLSCKKIKGKEDFHGNRDFYHLIKFCVRELAKRYQYEEKDKYKIEKEIAFLGFERNFGGFENENETSIKIIKDLYSGNQNDNNYEVLNRIKENIIDINSRNLLAISESTLGLFLIKSILPETKKDYNIYFGSPFYKDRNNEEYFLKILNKIQLVMQEGKILILKNLEYIYPLLYDLFNQNYTRYSDKNYTRIAAGPFVSDFTIVNNEFRCIVSVNDKQIKEEEPPFLNRFEKQIISLKYLLKKDLIDESSNILDKLKKMIILDKNIFKGINYDLEKILINFNQEEIQAIMYQALQSEVDKEQMFDKVIEKISLTLPQDIILCLKLNGFYRKNPDLLKKILKAYNKGEHYNLRRFLKSMTKKKNIIYTYTNNLEEIKITEEINNKIVGKISNENIREIRISECKYENDLEKEIDKFYETKKEKICFIKFNPNEGHIINYVQFFIENKQKELFGEKNEENNNEKIFIFIVNLFRIYDYEKDNKREKIIK